MRNGGRRAEVRRRLEAAAAPGRVFRRGPRVGRAVWLFPAALALHVLEEAPGFTEWVNRYASRRYTSGDFVRINALGLVGTTAGTLAVARSRNRALFFLYYTALLTQQAAFNPLFHAGTTAKFRAYSPGLVTSVALFPPLWYSLTRLAVREGLLTRGKVAGALVIGGLLHTVAVAEQVFSVELTRLRRGGA